MGKVRYVFQSSLSSLQQTEKLGLSGVYQVYFFYEVFIIPFFDMEYFFIVSQY
jgi:hypothetical protein